MRKFFILFFTLWANSAFSQTCDLEFISYNPINHEVEVAFLDATNCGCNEYTQQDGNSCENGSSTVNNNENVTNLVFGLHYDNFDIVPGDYGCSASTNFHPGWTYVVANQINTAWETGDTAKFSLNPGFGWECILNNPIDTVCWEVVIWQINLSQTVDIVDFPNDYWTDTCGTCANQTQMYPDVDLSNNSIIFCPGQVFEVYGCMYEEALNYDPLATIDDGSCEYEDCPVYGCTNPVACNYDSNATINDGSCVTCDSPYELGLAVCSNWEWYVALFDDCGVIEECDTVYIELPPDTLTIIDVVDNFIYDTVYVELPPDTIIQTQIDTVITTEYVYIIDSITTYITDTVFVDNPIIYGCTWPISCNYNDEATVDDGSCLDCDTPYEVGEILCDEYHGIDGYWDWWIELKNCDIEPPIEQCDTVYIQLPPDTITVTEIEFIYDTIYIDNYIYEYDTLYLTEYITLIDTITEYIVQEIWIDCNTGLPCEEEPPGIDCPDWTTIHIPNTFTPNNDGFNDTWQIIYDLYCWEDVEFWIYNRWGEEIYHDYGSSFDSYPFWDGSVRGGDYYVADGVYVYIVEGKKVGRAEVVKEQGHITVFR